MNNKARFQETVEALTSFQNECNALDLHAETVSISKGRFSSASHKAFISALQSKELMIDCKKGIAIFTSLNMGDYRNPIYRKKGRFHVLPICFMVELYKADLKESKIKSIDRIEIPFHLRGFWKVKKAMELLRELADLEISQANELERISQKLKKKESKQIRGIIKQIEVLDIQPEKNGKIELNFADQNCVFKINTKNVKLDMVPLCQMMTRYYGSILKKIDAFLRLCEKKNTKEVKELSAVRENFQNFMEKYFTFDQFK